MSNPDLPKQTKSPVKLGVIIDLGRIDPRLLTVAPTNNRTIPIAETDKLEMNSSIREIGVVEPIIINTKNQIIQGQLRWASAISNNLDSVPYIKMEFPDTFSERVTSIIQDYLHHPLEEMDKFYFTKHCVEDDGKTFKDIAQALGVTEQVVRGWSRWDETPKVVEHIPEAKKRILGLPNKKKLIVNAVLNKPEYENDVNKSMNLIGAAEKLSLRGLEQIKKDVNKHTVVDENSRVKRQQENCTLMQIKIPKHIDIAFTKKLRILGWDFEATIIKLMEDFIRADTVCQQSQDHPT